MQISALARVSLAEAEKFAPETQRAFAMKTKEKLSSKEKTQTGIAKWFRTLVGKLPSQRTSRVLRCETLESRQLSAADVFVGMYDEGSWTLGDNPAQRIHFGLHGDQPVMGDWDGDGRKTPGVFRGGKWVLDISGNGFDDADRTIWFGLPGDQPVAGDWDGDGVDTVGVFRNGTWIFDRNGNGFDSADVDSVLFGWGSDTPVVGDWDGDGKDTPGVFRKGIWVLDLTGNGYDNGDKFLQFGLPKDQPVSGDWNGDGKDTPGVLQNNRWFFDLEGDGYTGEVGQPNRFGSGRAVSGSSSIGPRPTVPRPPLEFISPGVPGGPVSGGPVSGGPVSGGPVYGTPVNPGIPSTPVKPVSPPRPSNPVKPLPTPTPIAAPEIEVDGVTDGQEAAVSFGSANMGATLVRSFTIRNTGTATLTLGRLELPSGFSVVSNLPQNLAPKASYVLQISLDTKTAGLKSGSIAFVTNDADEAVFNFKIEGVVHAAVTSNFGVVTEHQTVVGSSGSMILKTVQTYGASGNNIRLYADFLASSGGVIRSDVLIGEPNSSFGDQTMPQVVSLSDGRYVIAWRNTSLSGRTDIRFSLVNATGAIIGVSDRQANIGYSSKLELRSVTSTASGFRIAWFDSSTNTMIQRDFNSAGVAMGLRSRSR